MPRRAASATASRLASGNCQRLSSNVPSISKAIRRTAMRQCYPSQPFYPVLRCRGGPLCRPEHQWRATDVARLGQRLKKMAVLKSPFMATHRIYYDDAYARDFSAKVLTCEAVPPNVQAGITRKAWAVVLDRTALYPASGGQPHDGGKLGDANVLDVRDEGEEIVHIVDRELHEGAVPGCVDWPRRFDHMQQHTGQHLLSAVFQDRVALPTVSFHLGEELCTIDLRGAEPSEEILQGVER